jgi:hypothetical protein
MWCLILVSRRGGPYPPDRDSKSWRKKLSKERSRLGRQCIRKLCETRMGLG